MSPQILAHARCETSEAMPVSPPGSAGWRCSKMRMPLPQAAGEGVARCQYNERSSDNAVRPEAALSMASTMRSRVPDATAWCLRAGSSAPWRMRVLASVVSRQTSKMPMRPLNPVPAQESQPTGFHKESGATAPLSRIHARSASVISASSRHRVHSRRASR